MRTTSKTKKWLNDCLNLVAGDLAMPLVRLSMPLILMVSTWMPGTGLLRCHAQEANIEHLRTALFFHASFDGTADAKVQRGDGKVYTTESLARKEWTAGIHRSDVTIAKGSGVFGDCLHFSDKNPKVICYRGDVLPYRNDGNVQAPWNGTVAFWMRLDADQDLKPGYCDPIQITQKAWNDGAFFVDFDKDLPRDFRLGVFSDLTFWNPENTPWEKWPLEKRPMVTVKKPGFTRTAWKHVAYTFEGVNAPGGKPAQASLYLDGKLQGTLNSPMRFTWDLDKTAVMIGIEYIGDLDELMMFDRALSEKEIQVVIQGKAGNP